jgi:hypothetical protein
MGDIDSPLYVHDTRGIDTLLQKKAESQPKNSANIFSNLKQIRKAIVQYTE